MLFLVRQSEGVVAEKNGACPSGGIHLRCPPRVRSTAHPPAMASITKARKSLDGVRFLLFFIVNDSAPMALCGSLYTSERVSEEDESSESCILAVLSDCGAMLIPSENGPRESRSTELLYLTIVARRQGGCFDPYLNYGVPEPRSRETTLRFPRSIGVKVLKNRMRGTSEYALPIQCPIRQRESRG